MSDNQRKAMQEEADQGEGRPSDVGDRPRNRDAQRTRARTTAYVKAARFVGSTQARRVERVSGGGLLDSERFTSLEKRVKEIDQRLRQLESVVRQVDHLLNRVARVTGR